MSRVRKLAIAISLLLVLSATFVYGAYKPTNLDTKLPPKLMEKATSIPDTAEVIYENETFVYGFKETRDVLYVTDKRNGYTWTTGLDIAPAKEVKAALRKDEALGKEPLESKMNETFTAIANSFVTLEYYDDSNNIKRLPSSGEGATSVLSQVVSEEGHFILDVTYEEPEIALRVHLYLNEAGYDVAIGQDEITGPGTESLAAVLLSPFLGASGGEYQVYDEETGKHGDKIKKPEIPGYVFVPDGSGALIRFNDYNVSLKAYEAKIYGNNIAKDTYNIVNEYDSFVPFKTPVMPVFGISHGQDQNAFVGYATKGDAHMEVVVVPEENTTLYTWAYPRFTYNNLFHQVFNKRGDGYFTLGEDQDAYDIHFSYDFLAGDGTTGYSADYVGMAKSYRDYLIDSGILTVKPSTEGKIPMRVDFVMSDQKKSVIGYENAVTTTADGALKILEDMVDDQGYNLNVGLLGWQDGGITVAKPWATDFSGQIGSKGQFRDLLTQAGALGIDVSMTTDYVNINSNQMTLISNAAKHRNGWYLTRFLWGDVPFTEFAYAKPEKAVSWLDKQAKDLQDLGITSHSIEGIPSMLYSSYGNDPLDEEGVIKAYQEALNELSTDLKLNLKRPNQYLWQYTDRYLDIPVYPTQFLIETDTVPFLQLVLSGTMEMYGPYSNFSFYGDKDVLRMIDYNIYPSFVLTDGPAYLLSTTNSLNYYSTEYDQYKEVMAKVYDRVNLALGAVKDELWVDRTVLTDGIIKNTYSGGTQVVINYTDDPYKYEDVTLGPLSFAVIK